MHDKPLTPAAVVSIAHLLIQAAALAAYWAVLFTFPAARAPFIPAGAGDAALLAFAIGDLSIYGGTSAAGAWGAWRRRRWTGPVLWVHAGAAVYAALYAFALAAFDPGRWIGAAMMAPALVAPAVIARWWAGNRETVAA